MLKTQAMCIANDAVFPSEAIIKKSGLAKGKPNADVHQLSYVLRDYCINRGFLKTTGRFYVQSAWENPNMKKIVKELLELGLSVVPEVEVDEEKLQKWLLE
jgi:hypothetical protein